MIKGSDTCKQSEEKADMSDRWKERTTIPP